jgi:hypothetical protein
VRSRGSLLPLLHLALVSAVAAGSTAPGCGLLPESEPTEAESSTATSLAEETGEPLPPPAPDGAEAGSTGVATDLERIQDLQSRVESRLDARPHTLRAATEDALAEGAVIAAVAALIALVAFAYRRHPVGLALAAAVLGLLVATAAFVNSAL